MVTGQKKRLSYTTSQLGAGNEKDNLCACLFKYYGDSLSYKSFFFVDDSYSCRYWQRWKTIPFIEYPELSYNLQSIRSKKQFLTNRTKTPNNLIIYVYGKTWQSSPQYKKIWKNKKTLDKDSSIYYTNDRIRKKVVKYGRSKRCDVN